MPAATLTDGPLVSIIVCGRGFGLLPIELRDLLGRLSYGQVDVVHVASSTTGRADAIAAAVLAADGELVCLLDVAAEPLGADWLGHLVESVLSGAVAAGPLIIRARGRGLVAASQEEPDLSLLSGGIDLARAWGVALPRHVAVGDDPADRAGRVSQVPLISTACLVARREDLVAADIPRSYTYDGVGGRLAATLWFDADLCLRLRSAGGTIVCDGRAAVTYDDGLAQGPPSGSPRGSSEPLFNADRATFLGRWGPRLAREVLLDIVDGGHQWSVQPLMVAVVDDVAGLPPGPSTHGLDWRTKSVPSVAFAGVGAKATGASVALRDVDVLIVGDPVSDVRGTPTGLIRVAWIEAEGSIPSELPEFDLVIAATRSLAERVEPRAGKPVMVADLRARDAGHELQRTLLAWVRAPRLAIRIGASNWLNARTWGDYHFGRALQRSLEAAGYPTRVRLLRDWASDGAARDDATIHLFGLIAADNRAAQVNVLWQISHPELASADLYDRYDIAFVASDRFAEQMAGIARGPVVALHQATDPERFHPDTVGASHELLYVANYREDRPIVEWLIPTDHDLAVFGRGWPEHGLDPRYYGGEHIPNDQLHRAYASAAIVLNDTWADMREAGFISNRIYDALASGAFVLSDQVAGLDREFDGGVVAYRDRAELRAAVDRFLADPVARRELAERGRRAVLARHTFAQRAETILAGLRPLLLGRPRRIAEDRPALD